VSYLGSAQLLAKTKVHDERKIRLRARYENFIGGEWVAPLKGGYFENLSPTTGQVICQIARSQAEDVERAIDAAHAAAPESGHTPVATRAAILNRVADRLEQYLPFLATVETYDNGKPIRETNLADLPLAVDHFRYFASCVRAQEGSLDAVWKLAPALAAGNAVVLKPAEQTPLSVLVPAELVQDIPPPGVLNIVNGFGLEAGKPLA
jgi:aldehyde dehydrogenase